MFKVGVGRVVDRNLTVGSLREVRIVLLNCQKTTEHPYSMVNLAVLQSDNIASIEVIYQKNRGLF